MDGGIYSEELHIASLAVQRASLCTQLAADAAARGTLEKDDASVVTVADFAAQALLIAAIHHKFPDDAFLGEESATALRGNQALQDQIWGLVSSTKLVDPTSDALLATPSTKEEMLDVIDLGKKTISDQGRGRFWILDPIDGTSTFLRGEQYAVCLALVENGEQKIGVLGCPNLSKERWSIRDGLDGQSDHGLMLFAVAGKGAYARPISIGDLAPARLLAELQAIKNVVDLRFIDSPTHPAISHAKHRRVAEVLGIPWPGTDVWAMQVKYAGLALGQGHVVIRIPPNEHFRPYVWDHAGGQLIFKEAGGKLTDLAGRPFDYTAGTRFENNYGLVAAPISLHGQVLEAVQKVLSPSHEKV